MWHGLCFITAMMHIPAVDQAVLLLLIVLCLGTCLVRVFWQMEQARSRRTASTRTRSTTKRD
ncbi:hypothetical protein BCCGELA001_18390 [Bradyrhizobium sp. CCGE-LA001]|nr:hypothetical protein BCCGELA001_18390 [Bradyrhizobium sp. CCGE-LA001]